MESMKRVFNLEAHDALEKFEWAVETLKHLVFRQDAGFFVAAADNTAFRNLVSDPARLFRLYRDPGVYGVKPREGDMIRFGFPGLIRFYQVMRVESTDGPTGMDQFDVKIVFVVHPDGKVENYWKPRKPNKTWWQRIKAWLKLMHVRLFTVG